MTKKQNSAILSVGKGITSVGGSIWGGWSGLIIVNSNTVEMLSFVTPKAMVVTNFQYYIDHLTGIDTHYSIGWNLKLNGISVIETRWKATDTQHFNDLDANSFIIPSNTECIIESSTSHSGDVSTYAVITLKETEA